MLKLPKSPYVAGEEKLYEDDPLEPTSRIPKVLPKEYKPQILEKEEPASRRLATSVIKKMIKDMQITEVEPLELIGSEVVGNLFDRVRFLKERKSEAEDAIRERTQMNKTFNDEMDKDIVDMEAVLAHISEKDELREFKLNLSLLRMEKRKENTVFWRDMVALRKSLQELREEYENELKISELFGGLNDGSK